MTPLGIVLVAVVVGASIYLIRQYLGGEFRVDDLDPLSDEWRVPRWR